jgi:hypothetical protein
MIGKEVIGDEKNFTSITGYFDLDSIKPLDFFQTYHNITLSEVKTLENTLSHSQVFSIILGEK